MKYILVLMLIFAGVLQAATVTDSLTHRWTFSERGAPYIDDIGGVEINPARSDHAGISVAKETDGEMTGIMIGNAEQSDTLGLLQATSTFFDNGRDYTLEIVFRAKGGTVGTAATCNFVSIADDYSVSSPTGVNVGRYMTGSEQSYRARVKGATGGTVTLTSYAANSQITGQVHHMAIVSNELNDSLFTFQAPLETATVTQTDGDVIATGAPADTKINIGDMRYFGAELHILEIRFYNKSLTEAQINTNHTADIAAYGAGAIDVWVDSKVSTNGYGLPTSPYNTLLTAWQRISPGSQINLAKGSYSSVTMITESTDPSALDNISIVGDYSDTDGVVIHAGATATDYPIEIDEGSWAFKYLKFDADSVAGYCMFASAKEVTSLTATSCEFTNTLYGGVGVGTGLMSRAQLTVVDSCTFTELEEHGVYLRNYQAAADYTGSRISNSTFTDWGRYGVQISNEGDTTYTHNNLKIYGNTFSSPKTNAAGGVVIGGTDSCLVYDNVIDFTGVTAATAKGVSMGGSVKTGAEDGFVYNNNIINVVNGLYGGDGAAAGYIPHDMRFYSNYTQGTTTTFNENNMAVYKIRHNLAYETVTTDLPDSTGNANDEEISPWRRSYGGAPSSYALEGIVYSAQGFGPMGVQVATEVLDPVIGTGTIGFESPYDAWQRIIDIGSAQTGIDLQMYGGTSNQMNLDIWLSEYASGRGDTLDVVRVLAE